MVRKKRKIDKTLNQIRVEALSDIDFHYNSGFDYWSYWDGDCEAYGCDEEGICRCSSLEEATITKYDADTCVDKICEALNLSGAKTVRAATRLWNLVEKRFDMGGLDRHNDGGGNGLFEIKVDPGYYGDEVDGIYLGQAVVSMFASIDWSDSKKAMEQVIKLEKDYKKNG
jgi:hypothetical protein